MNANNGIPFKWEKLAPGIYAFLQPSGIHIGNAGFVEGKHWATAISCLTNKYMMENFIGKIKEVTDKPVRLVLNMHTNNVSTNYLFPEALFICAPACREFTVTAQKTYPQTIKVVQRYIQEKAGTLQSCELTNEGAKWVPQDITFEGTLKIYDGEREIQLIHLGQSHCQDDSIVYLPQEKVVFTGEIFAPGLLPMGVHKFWGGSVHGLIKALETIASLDAKLFVPGHGMAVLSRKEATYRISEGLEFLVFLRNAARDGLDQGMTYQQTWEKLKTGNQLKKWIERDAIEKPADVTWCDSMLKANIATIYAELEGKPTGSIQKE
jgi:cyclase